MNFVAYIRVSTKKQDNGLDVQINQIKSYVKSVNGTLLQVFSEKESGKNDNRTELKNAIEFCKKNNATLTIQKIDRLSRNVSFIFQLKEQLEKNKINFVCTELPELNTLTLGIFATFAQYERELISSRTKKGLQVAKANGKQIGRRENLTSEAMQKGATANKTKAILNENTKKAVELIKIYRQKKISYNEIATKLNEQGFTTAKNCKYNAIQVQRIAKRSI